MSVLQPDGVALGALAPVEAALEELQRRICRLVLEALLVELQVRFQVGWEEIQRMYGGLYVQYGICIGLPVPPLSPSPSPCSWLCPRASGCRARSCWMMCARGRRASAGIFGVCGIPLSRCDLG